MEYKLGLNKDPIDRRTLNRWILIGTISFLLVWYAIVPVSGYYSGFLASFSVGSTAGYSTVGSGVVELTVGEGAPVPAPASANNITAFPLTQTVSLIAPAILMFSLIIFMFWLTFSTYRSGNKLGAIFTAMIAFILIGVTVLFGVPIMLQGFDYILWGGW